MQTFLERAAAHVFQKYSGKLNRTIVILPTNRACFFFKRAMAMQTEEPVWAPRILPIDDFITQTADAELVEPISLLWILFDVCKEIDPNVQFDRFTAWAHTLLQDFDKIDQYLVDTKQLFDYLSKAKTLERWQPDILPNQPLPTASKVTDNYFKLWENLDQTYIRLKKRLSEQKKGYRGMMYRWVAENPDALVENPDVDQYIFVGLNALSFAEEKMVKFLVKEKKAEVLWDTDSYYMDKNTEVKAGDLLRSYKNEGKFGPWNWQTDFLLTQPKDIYLVGVPNASMQGKIASQIYLQEMQQKRAVEEVPGNYRHDAGMTAIVLPDENLLLPVLQSLDPEVEDFNITMGLSLRNSGLFTLINLLFEMQYLVFSDAKESHKTVKFNHRNVIKVLTHPLIKHYEQLFLQDTDEREEHTASDKNFIRHTLRAITEGNKVYLSAQELFQLGNHHVLFRTLFTPWNGEVQKALNCFYQLITILRQVYKNQKDAIETEYLYLFYTIVRRLETILKERRDQPGAEHLSLRSFKLFLYELFKQTKIPFTGEPVSQLQIMGMLETRTLDFETVIVLSVNEKTLPQAKKQNSLIPLDASMQFGLPNYRSQEVTMSYHFYRLLQRARNIYLLHVLPSDTYGAGEKSRFIHQIEHELAKQNPLIRLHYQTVQIRERKEIHAPEALQIRKTKALQTQIIQSMQRGITPSQMNSYIRCTLQYYFNYLANITADEEVEESIGASKFGTIVHKALEDIDTELSRQHQLIYENDLDTIIDSVPERVKRAFEETFFGYTIDNGLNYLLYKVAVRVIRNFLQHQKASESFPIEILGLEKSLNAHVVFEIAGQTVPVLIYGRIDRIDKTGNTIRVIDYKTGKVEKKHLKIPELDKEEFLLMNPDADKVRQLWLYKYILAKRMLQEKGLRLANRYLHADEHNLVSGIFSFRNIKDGLLDVALHFSDSPDESLETFVAHTEAYLNKIVATMLDPYQPFERTSRLQSCAHCQYKRICNR